ncbi:AAA family ATPase [Arthrobacter psychrolactophilus]
MPRKRGWRLRVKNSRRHDQEQPVPVNGAGPGQQSGRHPGDSGSIVAVWGPTGSPGRTTVAINLAAEQAVKGHKVLLIDADSYGASVAAALGLLDEAASFAQACRVADQGGMSAGELTKTVTQVVFEGGSFSLLTGLTRADRWPELRAAAVERVLDAARKIAEVVIVDCGFALENDEELSYDTVAPRRNAATLAVLGRADLVYAVGNSDPIGIPRLIRGLDELGQACPGSSIKVVVNKVRRKAVGGAPEKSLVHAWERFGPDYDIAHFLPWAPDLTDKALLEGRLLRELSPDAPLSIAIRGMSCAADQ